MRIDNAQQDSKLDLHPIGLHSKEIFPVMPIETNLSNEMAVVEGKFPASGQRIEILIPPYPECYLVCFLFYVFALEHLGTE